MFYVCVHLRRFEFKLRIETEHYEGPSRFGWLVCLEDPAGHLTAEDDSFIRDRPSERSPALDAAASMCCSTNGPVVSSLNSERFAFSAIDRQSTSGMESVALEVR